MRGYLRIYEPNFLSNSTDQLLFEKKFEEPILQIDIGNYVIRSDENLLGILQSNRFFLLKIPQIKRSNKYRNKIR